MAKSTSTKIDLKKEAIAANTEGEVEGLVTEALLLELCPPELLKTFKAAKTPAAKADFLYTLYNGELKKRRDAYNAADNFQKKLKTWFSQELRNDQTGVTGRLGRVEIKKKDVASVTDWTKFYAYVAKKKEFDFFNKAINQKAVDQRWEAGKEIPGVGRFTAFSISLTGVKGVK